MSIKLTTKQKAKPIYTAADHASRLAVGIYAIIQPILLRENRMRRKLEYFWVLGVDNDRYLKFAELLALGGQNRVHIKPADAFRMAIYKETDYVIFIHNHPTGKLQPSPEDKDATDRLIKAADTACGGTSVVDIKVADHFIISETKYYSFAEAGLMKQLRESSTYRVLHVDEVELLKLQMQAVGKEEGLKEGKAIGKDEKAKEIATKVLKQGFTVEQVAKLTGLSKAVVGKLKK